ncbi:MAG: saccharopine dehydrogenase NADP-binding domain-containing protein [Deltaproteobacteria bacterium]|nr:saccharopine dehydrogenase NADP-binding domain-containing protein [Deltaproteobacteria bacterium]
MTYLVLGAGRMGSAIAWDLAMRAGKDKVRIVDAREAVARAVGESLGVAWGSADLRDDDAVRPLLRAADVAVSAADYSLNERLTRLAIEERTHLCDLGGNNTVVGRQLAMSLAAERAGVTVVPDCGLAPGLACLLAARGVELLGRAKSVRIRVGGLPQDPRPPLGYALFFSVRGLTNEYLEQAEVVRDGETVHVRSMTEVESLEFPPPFGKLEAFHTSGGASTLPATLAGLVDDLDYKTIRYPGHCAIVGAMIELGFLSDKAVRIGEADVVPRAFSEALLTKALGYETPDAVLVRVIVEGADERIVYQLVDRLDPSTGHTAMARTTGYPTAAIAWMLGTGKITKRGVVPGERCVPVDALVTALAERNVRIDQRREAV